MNSIYSWIIEKNTFHMYNEMVTGYFVVFDEGLITEVEICH